MTFARPTLKTLIDRAIADVNARLPGADARLANSNLNVLAHVAAAGAHGLYGFLDWIARQMIYDTAEGEYLDRWAAIWGIPRLQAAPASGFACFTGAADVVIHAGCELSRADGAVFRTDVGKILNGETLIPITAIVPGKGGNAAPNSQLRLTVPIPGADSVALVAEGGITGGTDLEPDEALRERLLFRIQQPPMGGAPHDYIAWAKEVPGVTRVWVAAGEMGIGTVTVRFVRDNDEAIFPDPGEVATVAAHLEEKRPVTAIVYVCAPEPMPVNLTIRVTPDTPAIREAVEAELQDLFYRESEPGKRIFRSHIAEAISLAEGEVDHELIAPAGDVVPGFNAMPAFGEITWQ